MSNNITRGCDPDAVLQRVVDLTSAEVKRLEAKHREDSPQCDVCGAGGQLTKEERGFLAASLKEFRMLAFGARKLLTDRHLRKLGDPAVAALQQAIEGEKPGEWLDNG